MCSICDMKGAKPETVILRARIDAKRKATAEKILERLGMTTTQAINLFFAQIVERKAIPFVIGLTGNSDNTVPIETIAEVWNSLDDTDYSYLKNEV
jgi:addiction module RelB/DinJ family antitoxin